MKTTASPQKPLQYLQINNNNKNNNQIIQNNICGVKDNYTENIILSSPIWPHNQTEKKKSKLYCPR
jgi:hypothetical protein